MEKTTNATGTLAATYIRVSGEGQLGRDGNDDGYSIPAQQTATMRKAEDLGLTVVKAYVERAESAKSDERPVFQMMLTELKSLGVRYLIVHRVDRFMRNRLEDALIYKQLKDMGVTLVSATENIDDTPSGRLMHGMLATIAEYFSNNLASEVKKGLHQKHEEGGTPFRAPIGYLNTQRVENGHDIRSVVVDDQRAPLVRMAFELYASGQWPLVKLTAHLEQLGLVSRPTTKRPAHPLGVSSIHRMLSNRYYIGIVEYRGKTVIGRHKPLVSKQTFEKVQGLLIASRCGERASKHEHYLRGTIFCAECGGRLIFGLHRGRSAHYPYFSCVNRTTRGQGKGTCGTGFHPAALVEKKVEDLYARVRLSNPAIEEIRENVVADLDSEQKIVEKEAARHVRRIREIETKQEKLVELFMKELASEDVLKKQQDVLASEKAAAERLLGAAHATAQDILAPLDVALSFAARPQDAYLRARPLERRMMNAMFFERIEIGVGGEPTDVNLAPVFESMRPWQSSLGTVPNPQALSGLVRPSSCSLHCLTRFRTPVHSRSGRGSLLCNACGARGSLGVHSAVQASIEGAGYELDDQGRDGCTGGLCGADGRIRR